MKKYFNILVLFTVFFTVSSLVYSHSIKEGNNGHEKKYFKLAANITENDYLPQTIIVKVKAQYRSACTKNGINISSLNKVLGSISAVTAKKKFPNHIPPP